jgi:hypothetical protein
MQVLGSVAVVPAMVAAWAAGPAGSAGSVGSAASAGSAEGGRAAARLMVPRPADAPLVPRAESAEVARQSGPA